MPRKPLFVAAIAAAAALTIPLQASAHDPVAGAIIGGVIGGAAGGPPGAAAGAIIGGIIGSEGHHHPHGYYRGAPYYAPPPVAYAPRTYYAPPSTYYAPPQEYYAPPPVAYAPPPVYYAPPVVYRAAPVYAYGPRYVSRGYYGPHYRHYNGRHDGGRYRDGYGRR